MIRGKFQKRERAGNESFRCNDSFSTMFRKSASLLHYYCPQRQQSPKSNQKESTHLQVCVASDLTPEVRHVGEPVLGFAGQSAVNGLDQACGKVAAPPLDGDCWLRENHQ